MYSRNLSNGHAGHMKELVASTSASEENRQSRELRILNTKISKPCSSAHVISRPRLIEQLNEGLQHKLTLVTAPAGYGKTTLLNEWAKTVIHSYAVSWVSIDSNDTDTIRFWSHILFSLKTQNASLDDIALSRFSFTQYSTIENTLTVLINALTAIPYDFVLILDNYSAIDSPSIHRGIALLLEYFPSHMHLIIASRTTPPLHLARLRIENQLVELSAADMRFTSQEIKLFHTQMFDRTPSEDVLTAIENDTEGWVAGLCIAASSLQQGTATSFLHDNQLNSFYRHVRDYLDDEVFSPLPKYVQDFLLHTAVLDHLSGTICDVVTGQHNSLTLLEWLEFNNLFIIPLQNKPDTRRYHRLFRHFLLDYLHRVQPELLPIVHSRARVYYEQNGYEIKAIDHALAANDIDNATRLIEKAWTSVIETGEIALLKSWLENLPDEIVRSSYKLAFFYSWYQFFMGNFPEVAIWLKELKNRLSTLPELSGEQSESGALGEMYQGIEFLEALVLSSWCDASLGADGPINLLKRMKNRTLFWQHIDLLHTSIACWLTSGKGSKTQLFKPVRASRQDPQNIAGEFTAHCLLAQMHMQQGHLCKAERNFERALQIIELKRGTPQEYEYPIYLGMGQLSYERNHLNKAVSQLSESIAQSKQQDNERVLAYSYATLARVRQAQGEQTSASELIHLAEQWVQTQPVLSESDDYITICQIRLLLLRGEVNAAQQCLQRSDLLQPGSFNHTILARILLAQGKHREAYEVLKHLLVNAKRLKKRGNIIEIQILLALNSHKQAKIPESLAFLEQALLLAEREGYFRLFVDEGAGMSELITLFIEKQQCSDYLLPNPALLEYGKRILEVLSCSRVKKGTLSKSNLHKLNNINTSLVEALKEREIEVLYLIATGLSNQEIAKKMIIATSTVKWYIRNIYGKLNINSRAEAVALVYKQINAREE